VAVGKVATHLCLTLIVKELKISVEHGRMVTTIDILFSAVKYVGHIGFMLQFTTLSANATRCNCFNRCIVGNGMWQIDWRLRGTTYQLGGHAQYASRERERPNFHMAYAKTSKLRLLNMISWNQLTNIMDCWAM
jgi:hypothetical protein